MAPNNLPASLASLLPSYDRRSHSVECEDGVWVVAGRHALILVSQDGVVDSALWYEIQRGAWESETRTLSVVWVDPERAPLNLRTCGDPQAFMGAMSEAVHRSLVLLQSTVTASGTRITAQIRRREDGELFSILTTDGDISPSEAATADALEYAVREAVGLE